MRVLELLALEALLERRQVVGALLSRGFEQLLEHPVEVEVAQRAVEVVRAAHRTPGLHAGEALHGLAGHRPHHRLVAAEQRPHEEVGDLFRGERIHPAGAAATVGLALLVLHRPPHLVGFGAVAFGQAVLRAAQAEVHLEHGLERAPVGVVLHERRPEGVLERLAVVDRDVLHRLHRVEVLGEADRQAGVAQLDHEAVEQLDHLRARRRREQIRHRGDRTSRPPWHHASFSRDGSRWR